MKLALYLALGLATAPLAAQSAASPPAPAVADDVLLLRGRRLTEWLLSGRADSILAQMDPDLAERVGGAEGILAMTTRIALEAGGETAVVEEKMTRRNGRPQYWRQSRFERFVAEPIVIRWVFDAEGRLAGAGINPLSQTPPVD